MIIIDVTMQVLEKKVLKTDVALDQLSFSQSILNKTIENLKMHQFFFFFFFICMFYQVLGVPHSSSSTPTWGSVLPSIVETRDQNSQGCPLLFFFE